MNQIHSNPPQPDRSIQVCVRIPERTYRLISQAAQEQDRSRAAVMRRALIKEFDPQQPADTSLHARRRAERMRDPEFRDAYAEEAGASIPLAPVPVPGPSSLPHVSPSGSA